MQKKLEKEEGQVIQTNHEKKKEKTKWKWSQQEKIFLKEQGKEMNGNGKHFVSQSFNKLNWWFCGRNLVS